jgi:hypothetical protein
MIMCATAKPCFKLVTITGDLSVASRTLPPHDVEFDSVTPSSTK